MTTARKYFCVIFKRGPKWLSAKNVSEQALLEHRHFMQQLLDEGKLDFEGWFLDNEGGVAMLTVSSEAEAKHALACEPAIAKGIFVAELHPFEFAFDSATGLSPFPERLRGLVN